MRAYLLVGALLLAIFGSIAGYLAWRFSTFANMDFTPPPVTIAAGVAITQQRVPQLEAVGTVKAVRGVDLTCETSGEITAINFSSGGTVNAGDVLVVLNDQVEQASLRSQVANLELADVLYQRDSKLIKQKSIPESQYDRSKADLARAKAQLAETEARIRNKRIVAPFAGTVGIRQVDVGDYISPGTTIASLQDLTELEIDFNIPARYATGLSPGQAITLIVDAFPNRVFNANLQALDSRVDSDTLNLLARARINDGDGLLPGMFASLQIRMGESAALTVVPETAISYSLQGNTVYVISERDEGGLTVTAKVVQVGNVVNGNVAIISGIEPGDRVVTAGQNKLYRGASVVVDNSVEMQ
ncbi:efflux RND transporter periplasmic adaptor subunit [Halieaceae bacterium IMCC14734]|uniref:Efflux RND transporter periplasmic adaptor subunit n=1 Tax=Candidatus Litorirhabdus singularis TaxID=2518993 RepID=A0ABT3TI75_9GAMM|nr:efflux RND transporter periplasmic adaptor subunit [Candidatus Litorirhabdus singularis]MCX2981077.1 efflux RND transporter periplasmic adaptor subunit [Candidatus Litorirhabdus singularis]